MHLTIILLVVWVSCGIIAGILAWISNCKWIGWKGFLMWVSLGLFGLICFPSVSEESGDECD